MEAWDVVVVGGGAAGYFGALAAAEARPGMRIVILERGGEPLAKVHISGGGRCNVTHACFDPAELVQHYPRGGQELRGAFTRFHPGDMMDWLQRRGVKLVTEMDGRVFPASNRAETIVDCLLTEASRAGVKLRTQCAVQNIRHIVTGAFELACGDGSRLQAGRVLLAAGGAAKRAVQMAESLGHTILPLVPSLFTFEVRDARLQNLAGVSVRQAKLDLFPGAVKDERRSMVVSAQGAILVTHWGLSGPAVLRLSAWGARSLADCDYQARLRVNWLPGQTQEEVYSRLETLKHTHPRQQVLAHAIVEELPLRLWKSIAIASGMREEQTWEMQSKAILRRLSLELCQAEFTITGKGVFKEEFVTCGGVRLKEVDFRTMQSRLAPGVYFAGELLDIDGLTGGFNFQSAWTTGWIAGRAIAASLST